MIDFDILTRFKSTNKRLREVLTAGTQSTMAAAHETAEQRAERMKLDAQIKIDVANRQQIERRIRVRVDEGVVYSLKNYQFYAAADLAWDSSPVNKITIPLMLYAQGKINIQSAATALKGLNRGDEFVKKDESGNPVSIDLPKFHECSVNLVRSFVTRRLAAQSNKFEQLNPFYHYESRSTGQVGKLRADVLSQRVEMMTDQFGYRHHDTQCIRDAFLYGHAVDFIRASWEVEKQWVKKDVPDELASADPENFEVEAEIVREGVGFENIHPSKVFYDNCYPLSSINTDTGCEFIGYWDVKRFRDVANNTSFFNTTAIGWSTKFWGMGGIYLNYKAYFDQFATTITPPSLPEGTVLDPAGENDRKVNIGVYSVDMQDTSILVTTYFEKLVPKDYGIGDYPFPVWVRFIVASDATVVFAEFLPSTPAAYLGINESDARQINVGIAHQLMAYQDQLTNLFAEMLLTVQQELVKVFGINTDVIDKPENITYLRNWFKGNNWGNGTPIVVEYSLKKLEDMGLKSDKMITVTETRAGQSLTAIFEAIAKLLMMAERLEAMSPNEQGQPAPREISATEVTEIASTTTSVYSFISRGVDEFRAAKKRIIYESIVTCHEGDIYCPVEERYPLKVVEQAGFKIDQQEIEGFQPDNGINKHTVIGTRRQLIHDYVFTSRDGDERAVNTQAANTLVQLLSQMLNIPAVLAGMGKEKLYEIVNEIFRKCGAGLDLNLELKPGEDNTLGGDQIKQFQQVLQQMQQAIQQVGQVLQKNEKDVQGLQQHQASMEQHMKLLVQLGQQVEGIVKNNAVKESIAISYKDMPPSIKRQAEVKAGFQPATEPPPISPP